MAGADAENQLHEFKVLVQNMNGSTMLVYKQLQLNSLKKNNNEYTSIIPRSVVFKIECTVEPR